MRHDAPLRAIHRLVWTALMAALTAVGAFIAVPVLPISPVPVSLQDFFVMLAGLILGPRGGMSAIALYVTAGGLGLPVFAGGKAGPAALLGPTGGYLLGFVLSPLVCGRAGGLPLKSFGRITFYCLLANGLVLLLGSAQLSLVMDISPGKGLALGFLPFVPGTVGKALAAAAAYRFLVTKRLAPLC